VAVDGDGRDTKLERNHFVVSTTFVGQGTGTDRDRVRRQLTDRRTVPISLSGLTAVASTSTSSEVETERGASC
jgi:hypothetical protein